MVLHRIDQVFNLHRAVSGLFTDYEAGTIPYIGNGGLADNGVVGLVKARDEDELIFNFPAIVVSAFCEATVQLPPFIACGRAGNGLVVLEPKTPVTLAQLAYVASYINLAVRWRFSWYRQTTARRLGPLRLPNPADVTSSFDVASVLPPIGKNHRPAWKPKLKSFVLDDLFQLTGGDHHSLGDLLPGTTPVVSCGDMNNGIAGKFKVDAIHEQQLTIALNGSPLTTHWHPYSFAAKDDVAVCVPRLPMPVTTQLFIATRLNSERWRYSYYRKCYLQKLRRFSILLPATPDGKLDHGLMAQLVKGSAYWPSLTAVFNALA